jgi:4-carboxymuconolactone decarboxylase
MALLDCERSSVAIEFPDEAANMCGSHVRQFDDILAPVNGSKEPGTRMPRIPIIDRADMNAEQARVYDEAKQSSGIVGGPYYAYIRLPKLFEACQNLRTCLSSGPLSRREQQIVNLVVARHWNARYPWFAQVRRSLSVGIDQAVIDAINARKTPSFADARERICFAVSSELLANKGLSDETYAAAEKSMGLESLVALVASTGSFSMTCLTAATFRIDSPPDDPTPLAE